MTKIIIEEVYTGGGCEHLSIQFINYGVQFDIMNANEYSTNQLPENGEPFCFNLCKIQDGIDGEYLDISDRIENYDSETIKDFCLGYLAARKMSNSLPWGDAAVNCGDDEPLALSLRAIAQYGQ